MDTIENSYFTLNDGTKMPKVGYGVYLIDSSDLVYKAIVEAGYRHIDTASFYENEELIGEALQRVFKETDIKREDLYIVTKIWGSQREDVEGAMKESLEKLQLEYVDMYLIHWPLPYKLEADGTKTFARIPMHKTWAEMEELVRKGYTKSIGISNFNVQSMIELLTYCEIKPVANQVELHPYNTQEGFIDFCKKVDILPIAFSPLTNPGYDEFGPPKSIFEQEIILELAQKYEKTPAQIVLNWGICRGYSVIPKTSTEKRLKENLDCQSFQLEESEVEKISELNTGWRALSSQKLPWTLTWDLFA